MRAALVALVIAAAGLAAPAGAQASTPHVTATVVQCSTVRVTWSGRTTVRCRVVRTSAPTTVRCTPVTLPWAGRTVARCTVVRGHR